MFEKKAVCDPTRQMDQPSRLSRFFNVNKTLNRRWNYVFRCFFRCWFDIKIAAGSWVRSSKLTFYLSSKWLFLQLNFVPKVLKLDIVFLRNNFVDNVITDQWKVDFEKKTLKIWESEESIGINISKVHLHMKILFLYQINFFKQFRE